MSLKVKCRKCNFNLDFDIRNPGLIVVSPCESCMAHPEDLVPGSSGVSGLNLTASGTDMSFEGVEMDSADTVIERMDETRDQALGKDDGNDWRAEKAR